MKKHTPKKTQRIIKAYAILIGGDIGAIARPNEIRLFKTRKLARGYSDNLSVPHEIQEIEIHLPAPQRVKKTK